VSPGRARPFLLGAAIALIAAVPLAYRLFHPFVTLADNNTAAFAQPARNFLRHGLIATKCGLAIDMGEAAAPSEFNTHHPPLMSMGAAVVFLFVGASDWASRLYPALCTLASALIVFALWRRARGDLAGALAASIMCLLPGFGHFGKMLGEETPSLALGLLTILLYFRWKEAPPGRAPIRLAGALAAYAAACLSGWPAFYVGAILMVDAVATLRPRGRALAWCAGAGVVAAAVFVATAIQLGVLAGSSLSLLDAGLERALASRSRVAGVGLADWIRKEHGYLIRLYGAWPLLFGIGGLISGLLVVSRRRARPEAVSLALVLAAFGVSHPLAFRWAAWFHDWMLLLLMPIVAIGAAEGILLLASGAGWVARRARAPQGLDLPLRAAVALFCGAVLLVTGARELRALATEEIGFAWPLLGAEVARRVDPASRLMSSFAFHPVRSAPLRFYADRAVRVVTDLEALEARLREGLFPLYVRDRTQSLPADLIERLESHPSDDVGIYRLYDLARRREAEEGAGDATSLPMGKAIDATFGGKAFLDAYEVGVPHGSPERRGLLASFFGAGVTVSPSQVLSVRSAWRLPPGVEPPDWKVLAIVTRPFEGGWLTLPSILLPESRDISLTRWKGAGAFLLESAFLHTGEMPAGDYEIRFGLFDRGTPIPPEMPGPPAPGRKVVVAGPVTLP
jgi:4-amino-4-deoxy-L-arabinose transferase-like glycosyltransferase